MLRNNSDMPKTLKNKMVSGNPRRYSTWKRFLLSTTNSKRESMYWDCNGRILKCLNSSLQEFLGLGPVMIHNPNCLHPSFPNPLQYPQPFIERHERKELQDKADDNVDGEDTDNCRNFCNA